MIGCLLEETKEELRAEVARRNPDMARETLDARVAELLPHFIFNVDEEGILASLCSAKILGDKQAHKHETISNSSRVSITALRGGNAAGSKTASIYLLTGKEIPDEYSEPDLLEDVGSPPGSCVIMTETAFMTNAGECNAHTRASCCFLQFYSCL